MDRRGVPGRHGRFGSAGRRGPVAALSGTPWGAGGLHLRRGSVHGGASRGRCPAADLRPEGVRDVRPLLAGWQNAGLHRPVRRQHRGLRDALRGRRTPAAHPHRDPRAGRRLGPDGPQQHRHGLEGRGNGRLSLASQPVEPLQGRTDAGPALGRSPGDTAGAPRGLVQLFTGRPADGLQPRLPRVPHVEALSRWPGR